MALFSKRRAEIEELLAESGNTSARAAQVATLDTRHAKEHGVDADTLEQRWRVEAAAAGFDADDVAACFGQPTTLDRDPAFEAALLAALAGPHGLTEESSTFCRSDVIETVASALGSQAAAREVEALADRFLVSGGALLVDRTPHGQADAEVDAADTSAYVIAPVSVRRSLTQLTYTTPALADLESKLLSWGADAEMGAATVPEITVNAVIHERPELSVEQRAMVIAACTADEFIQPIAGRPGAGKTYATEAVVAAHVASGVPIIGCAVSATAAAELERAAGFARSCGRGADTVSRLLLDLDDPRGGGLLPGAVIVVDEASMIGTRDFARLATAAREVGGALKLIGDPDQHGSVDVGGVFRRLCADRGARLVSLVDNNRQEDHAERLAIDEYREGCVADALDRYDHAGKIIRSATAGESFDAIASDWYAARLHGVHDPMVAGPNSIRHALNDRARALLKANGELQGAALVVAGREFMVGDEVVARRNDRSLHARGARDFVKNGSVGTVRSIDVDQGNLVVGFEREGHVPIPRRYLAAGQLDHAYARTTYGVQGATHHTTHYHPTDESSFEQGYVAITRARTASRIYIVDGTFATSDELSHAPDEHASRGISEIVGALNRRRAGHMAADVSPRLAALAATLEGTSLAELTHRRRQLNGVLATAPADTTRLIERTTAALDAIQVRAHTWNEQLSAAQQQLDQPSGSEAARHDASRLVVRSQAALDALAHATERLSTRLEAAHHQQGDRQAWLIEHNELVSEYELLRRAERVRDAEIRIASPYRVPEALRELIGDEPGSQRERVVWREAVGAVALYQARFPMTLSESREVREGILGTRPLDSLAAAAYDQVVAAVDAARITMDRPPLDAGLEL